MPQIVLRRATPFHWSEASTSYPAALLLASRSIMPCGSTLIVVLIVIQQGGIVTRTVTILLQPNAVVVLQYDIILIDLKQSDKKCS